MSREEISRLTYPQLLNELGADEAKGLTRAQIHERKMQAMDRAFVKACVSLKVTPEGLDRLPIETIVAALPGTPKTADVIAMLQTFLQRCNKANG